MELTDMSVSLIPIRIQGLSQSSLLISDKKVGIGA